MGKIRVLYGTISEFDMVSANVSVLAEEGLISDSMYRDLRETDKQERLVIIGTLMRDLSTDENFNLTHELGLYIKKYVDMFISDNNINESQILEIAKDAVFLHNVSPINSKFGDYIKFIEKNRYMCMIEFPQSEKSNNTIKIYKSSTETVCRGSKINKEHIAYKTLNKLLSDAINRKTITYMSLLKILINQLNAEKDKKLLNAVDNEWLVEVLKEVFNML